MTKKTLNIVLNVAGIGLGIAGLIRILFQDPNIFLSKA
jgi:hypothetical protein